MEHSESESQENVLCERCNIYYSTTSQVCNECGDHLHRQQHADRVYREESEAEGPDYHRVHEVVPKPIPPPFIETKVRIARHFSPKVTHFKVYSPHQKKVYLSRAEHSKLRGPGEK